MSCHIDMNHNDDDFVYLLSYGMLNDAWKKKKVHVNEKDTFELVRYLEKKLIDRSELE